MSAPTQTALERIEFLGRISDDPEHLVRTFLSPASRRAGESILEWMIALGMETSHTEDGTVRGILPGTNPTAAPLLLGSHHDTVIDAGKYDGALGIIAALAALETLREEGITLPYPVHVLGFSDEEGVRFQTTYLGSRLVTGSLDPDTLAATDASGLSIADALQTEGWNEGATPILYKPGESIGYIELHIEQGRVLEEANLPACAVSAINGQSRIKVKLTGRADHAGTTPMYLRRDALAGAAMCILATEATAHENGELVATVGTINIKPGVSNSIPQEAEFTIDFRHPNDDIRTKLLDELQDNCSTLATGRKLEIHWQSVQENDAVPCDQDLTNSLVEALHETVGIRRTLPSGAGHDGVAMSAVAPIAMIFLRSKNGLSHHPEEYTSPEDIAVGIQVIAKFLKNVA